MIKYFCVAAVALAFTAGCGNIMPPGSVAGLRNLDAKEFSGGSPEIHIDWPNLIVNTLSGQSNYDVALRPRRSAPNTLEIRANYVATTGKQASFDQAINLSDLGFAEKDVSGLEVNWVNANGSVTALNVTKRPPSSQPIPAPVKADQSSPVFTFSGDDSSVGFVVHIESGVREGGFSNFNGTISLAGGRLDTAVIEVTFAAKSLFSDSSFLTPKLSKRNDFLETDKFPNATFKSTKVVQQQDDPAMYVIAGTFNLHGIEQQITFPAEIAVNGKQLKATSKFSINRKDWQIVCGESDRLFKDEVLIRLEINATVPSAPR
ncbi:MAG: YceI family protein [Candidatus Hydrogenedentes bacterium]|nr:YceI family protein [Candidatus Hydrogenedentota bacterium]